MPSASRRTAKMSRTTVDVQEYRREKRRKRENPSQERPFEPPASSQEDDEDRFFVIERLLDKRLDRTGQEEYLVRWKNYDSSWDSWEPRSEIEKNARDMVQNFGNQDKACDNDLHCICRRPYKFNQGGMIQCFCCYKWFHFDCINMNIAQANKCLRYYCESCLKTNPTFKMIFKQPTQFYNDI